MNENIQIINEDDIDENMQPEFIGYDDDGFVIYRVKFDLF